MEMTGISFAQEKKVFSSKENMIYYIVKRTGNFGKELTDADKRKIEARIRAKLKSGKKLSSREMAYLRQYNTVLYQQAVRVQKIAEAVEEQLRNARSKEEARDIVGQAVLGIPDEDPAKEYLVAAIEETAKEFKKTNAYSHLPDTRKDAGEMEKPEPDNVEAGYNDADLYAWSPLQEIIDTMPQFSSEA